MGEVWLAEQQQPVRRRVALKIIKLGMDTREVVARFAAEQQALALMDHPGIARIFDAGATPEGRPYFVMEFVPGVPLNDYCDAQRLTIRARLELFMEICAAVQHAHHKAIIHRDLKPSNVLVADTDGKAAAKVIDFGVAKAMLMPLTDRTMVTQIGGAIGTPDYMSPEQLDPAGVDVDTRSDVYALGVMLYELLTGTHPIDTTSAGSIEEIRQRIRTEEPVRPSARLAGAKGKTIAEKRCVDVAVLARSLRGDLEWIVLKALEKDRNRRYGSPTELAGEIQRHLDNQPIVARPPSKTYRAGRFIARHRFGFAVSCAAGILLIGFAAMMTVLAARLARERDRATQEAESKQQIATFLQDLFSTSSPERAQGRVVSAREVLDRGVEKIRQLQSAQPPVRADLLTTMAAAFEGLGLYEDAERLSREAVEAATAITDVPNRRYFSAVAQRAAILRLQGRYAEGTALLEPLMQRAADANDAEILASLQHELGLLYARLQRNDEASRLMEAALAAKRRLYGSESEQALRTLNNLALLYHHVGRLQEATRLDNEILAIRRRILGSEHPLTLASINNLAFDYQASGRFDEARALLTEALKTGERVLGVDHPSFGTVLHSTGELELAAGNYAVAKIQLERALRTYERQIKHQNIPLVKYQLAETHARLGKPDEALRYLTEALAEGYKPTSPPSKDPHFASIVNEPRFPH